MLFLTLPFFLPFFPEYNPVIKVKKCKFCKKRGYMYYKELRVDYLNLNHNYDNTIYKKECKRCGNFSDKGVKRKIMINDLIKGL